MRSSKILVMLALTVALACMIGFAGDERQPASARTDANVTRTDASTPAETGVGLGEQVPPTFEPGLAQIQADFGKRMDALEAELAAATTEDMREEIQQRVTQLKQEWTLAFMDRQIELARERGDNDAVAEGLAAKQAMLNPPAVERTQVPRDPNAGIRVEGGAK